MWVDMVMWVINVANMGLWGSWPLNVMLWMVCLYLCKQYERAGAQTFYSNKLQLDLGLVPKMAAWWTVKHLGLWWKLSRPPYVTRHLGDFVSLCKVEMSHLNCCQQLFNTQKLNRQERVSVRVRVSDISWKQYLDLKNTKLDNVSVEKIWKYKIRPKL